MKLAVSEFPTTAKEAVNNSKITHKFNSYVAECPLTKYTLKQNSSYEIKINICDGFVDHKSQKSSDQH